MKTISYSVKRASDQFEKLTNICGRLRRIDLSFRIAIFQNASSCLAEAIRSGVGFEQRMGDVEAKETRVE